MASRSRRPPSESQADRELRLSLHTRTLIATGVTALIKWGGLLGIAYFMYCSVRVLSGQSTFADIGIRLLGNLRVSEAAAWLLGGSGILYGSRERRLRLQANETLGKRVSDLEGEIDAKRSSSKLTTKGQTHPRDSL